MDWWELSAISPEGTSLAQLRDQPPSAELLPLLPVGSYLLVGNCAPPRFVHPDDEPAVLIPAPAGGGAAS